MTRVFLPQALERVRGVAALARSVSAGKNGSPGVGPVNTRPSRRKASIWLVGMSILSTAGAPTSPTTPTWRATWADRAAQWPAAISASGPAWVKKDPCGCLCVWVLTGWTPWATIASTSPAAQPPRHAQPRPGQTPKRIARKRASNTVSPNTPPAREPQQPTATPSLTPRPRTNAGSATTTLAEQATAKEFLQHEAPSQLDLVAPGQGRCRAAAQNYPQLRKRGELRGARARVPFSPSGEDKTLQIARTGQ